MILFTFNQNIGLKPSIGVVHSLTRSALLDKLLNINRAVFLSPCSTALQNGLVLRGEEMFPPIFVLNGKTRYYVAFNVVVSYSRETLCILINKTDETFPTFGGHHIMN